MLIVFSTVLALTRAAPSKGEADSGENDRFSVANYECELRGLVTSYRRDFGQPNLPIIIVQLPGNDGGIGVQHDDDSQFATDEAEGCVFENFVFEINAHRTITFL